MELEQPAEMQDSEATASTANQASETREATGQDDDLSLDLLEEQATEDDEVEDELEGVKVRGKKDLIEKIKAERLMQADYTRKTQEVAEQRKAIEAVRAQVAQREQLAQQFVDELAAARAIDMRLGEYQKLDWAAIEAQDVQTALRLQREMRELQAAKEQVSHSIAQKHQQRTLSEQQEIAKQIQEGNAVLQREIKDWGPEKAAKVRDFALSRGFDETAIGRVTDPRVVRLLHDAMTLDGLRNAAKTKPKPEPQQAPVTRINAPKAGAQRDPEKMSTEEWVRWREAQVKRK